MPSQNEIGRIVEHLEPPERNVYKEAVVGHPVMTVTRECHGVISLKVCKPSSFTLQEGH